MNIYIYIYIYIYFGRPGFNPRSSLPKTQKMVLDTAKLKSQHYKVMIKGNVDQSRE